MSLVFLIFIIFVATILIFRSITFFTKTAQNKKEQLCSRLSQEGIANNLTFCSQEILHNKVIGIDGIHRKIMILEKIRNNYNCSIISLDEVENCGLVKNCGALHVNNLKRFDIEKNLHAIELQFEFKNHAQPTSIVFYDSLNNSKREFELLKAKAEYWSVMFSKMLTSQVRIRA